MKKKEFLFIAAVLVIALGLLGYQRFTRSDNYGEIQITAQGKDYGTYSLGKDLVIRINQTNVCEIKDGQAVMIEATCPDGLCKQFAPINETGGLIVCLPNDVMIQGLPAPSDK